MTRFLFIAVVLATFDSRSLRIGATVNRNDVSSAYDDLLPEFEKGGGSSPEFFMAIQQKLYLGSPKEEDMKTLIDAIISEKNVQYFKNKNFTSHSNLTGTVRYSTGLNTNASFYTFGKFAGSAEKGDYTSVALNFYNFEVNGVNVSPGFMFYSRVGFTIKGKVVKWQGVTKGTSFNVSANKTSTALKKYGGGVTKGFIQYFNNDKLQISINALGALNRRNGLNKTNTTYLGHVDLGEMPLQTITMDFSYHPTGRNGNMIYNTSFMNDGSIEFSGEGKYETMEGDTFTVNANLSGKSRFDAENPFSKDSLQQFFNTVFIR